MAEKFAVIGLGQFGSIVAKKLSERGAEVLAIDKDIERVELVKDDVAYAVALDSTDLRALSAQNVADMDAVLITIGENIEGLLLTTVQLLELNVKRIIARAMSEQQRLILDKLGVKEILSPEEEAASIIAETLINPSMKDFLPLPDDFEIAEIKAPVRIFKRTVAEIDFEPNYGLKLITIKRLFEEIRKGHKEVVEHLVVKISADTIIEPSDTLIVLGKSQDVDKFIEINR